MFTFFLFYLYIAYIYLAAFCFIALLKKAIHAENAAHLLVLSKLKKRSVHILTSCIILHCIALHCIALDCIALHCAFIAIFPNQFKAPHG